MGSMSRRKGKRGELEWAAFLTDRGAAARRGSQYHGGPDSPDVVCLALAEFHWEVKRVESFSLYDALDQACADAALGKVPTVAHRRNKRDWVVVLRGEDFVRLALMAKAGEKLAHAAAEEARTP